MFTMDENHLHQPLLPSHTIATAAEDVDRVDINKIISSNTGIALRLLLVFSVGVISLWASNEVSKGFMITVTNEMENTAVGDKFSLFYISDDEATRLVQGAFDFATKVLFPNANSMPEKLIGQVNVRLANHNSTRGHVVLTKQLHQENKFVISISPLIMEYKDFRYRIRKEIQKCMAEILLFNGQNGAPRTLIDGMIEYIGNLAGFNGPKPLLKLWDFNGKCWEDKDPKLVAEFLGYCQRNNGGIVGRLVQGMRDGWDEGTVDRALGLSAKEYCKSFHHHLVMNNADLNTT